jgi:Zn-dependent protease
MQDALEAERARRQRNLQAVASSMMQDAEARRASMPAGATWGPRLKRWGPLGMIAAFVLTKLGWIVMALKALKFGSLLSMVLMVWVYAQYWGLPFALGFVLLIFVHEMGHALAMRQQGIRFSAPVFIPFVGAVIAMRGMPRNAWVEAVVGIGGPVLGTVGAAVCMAVGIATGSAFWFALASTGFLLNLFNMIPVSPLDGGRVVGVLTRWLWLAGYLIGGIVFYATRSPIVFLILLLGLATLPRLLRDPPPGYYAVAPSRRLAMGFAYFGLIGVMAAGMMVSDQLGGADPSQLVAAGIATLAGLASPITRPWTSRAASAGSAP